MKKEKPIDDLKLLILQAEQKGRRLEEELGDEVKMFIENLNPVNFIKKGFNSLIQKENLTESAVKGGVGLLGAIVFKKFFLGRIKRRVIGALLGLGLKMGIGYLVENREQVKAKASNIINRLRTNRQETWKKN